MIEIAGGIILAVVGLMVLGAIVSGVANSRSEPAPEITVVPMKDWALGDWALVLLWPGFFAFLIGWRLLGWWLGW